MYSASRSGTASVKNFNPVQWLNTNTSARKQTRRAWLFSVLPISLLLLTQKKKIQNTCLFHLNVSESVTDTKGLTKKAVNAVNLAASSLTELVCSVIQGFITSCLVKLAPGYTGFKCTEQIPHNVIWLRTAAVVFIIFKFCCWLRTRKGSEDKHMGDMKSITFLFFDNYYCCKRYEVTDSQTLWCFSHRLCEATQNSDCVCVCGHMAAGSLSVSLFYQLVLTSFLPKQSLIIVLLSFCPSHLSFTPFKHLCSCSP